MSGVAVRGDHWFIPGEGWVRCAEIFRQVNEAFEAYRKRKALQGIYLPDAQIFAGTWGTGSTRKTQKNV